MGLVRLPFRREKDKPLDFGQLAVTLYASYGVSSAALRVLTERYAEGGTGTGTGTGAELRGPALQRARQAAQLNRAAFNAVMYMGLREEVPAGWLPLGALGAFARVIYGLVAIAETPPEPEALLAADELRRLAIQYDIEEWIHHWETRVKGGAAGTLGPAPTTGQNGDHPQPDPEPERVPGPTLALREALLADADLGDEYEYEPDARFLIARQEAAAGLLLDHAELLELVHQHYVRRGPSPHLETIAVQAAGNLATVLQPLRRRQDLLNLLIEDPDAPAVPMALIDQMLFSFVLLTGLRNERYLSAALSPEEIGEFMRSRAIQDWMDRLDPRELFDQPPGPRCGLS
jgi:hypothetical protein